MNLNINGWILNMIEIGNVVEAVVERVEPYGLFLQHGPEKVFVLLPEVSWLDKRDLRERYRVGDVQKVLIYRYNYPDQINVGSIRRLHPEENPYRELSRLEPRTVLAGRVKSLLGDEVTVDLPNGAFGHLPKCKVNGELQLGQPLQVIIFDLNVDEGRLGLDLAENLQRKTVNSAAASGEKKATIP